MAALTAREETPFVAAVQSSLGRIEPGGAARCMATMAVLASKDADRGLVVGFGQSLKGEKHGEVLKTQINGWMSAR